MLCPARNPNVLLFSRECLNERVTELEVGDGSGIRLMDSKRREIQG